MYAGIIFFYEQLNFTNRLRLQNIRRTIQTYSNHIGQQ